MNFDFKIIYFIILLIFMGCDNIDIVESEIEVIEKIVVHGELYADEHLTGIRISKTSSISSDSNSTQFIITDANPYLIINGIQIVPLHHTEDGIYSSKHKLRIIGGFKYEFFCEYNKIKIYSMTYVPKIPVVINPILVNNDFIKSDVSAKPNEVYGAIWIHSSVGNQQLFDSAIDFYSISNPIEKVSEKFISIRTTSLPQKYTDKYSINNIYMQVYAFDKSYLDYFKSRNNNEPISDIFSQGSGSILWNVSGENVIGLFIGVSRSTWQKLN